MGLAYHFKLEPHHLEDIDRFLTDIGKLYTFVGTRLECTHEHNAREGRCLGTTHVFPCPKAYLQRTEESFDKLLEVQRHSKVTLLALAKNAASVMRLFPHITCTCRRMPHKDGCAVLETVRLLGHFYDKYGVHKDLGRSVHKPVLPCFTGSQ